MNPHLTSNEWFLFSRNAMYVWEPSDLCEAGGPPCYKSVFPNLARDRGDIPSFPTVNSLLPYSSFQLSQSFIYYVLLPITWASIWGDCPCLRLVALIVSQFMLLWSVPTFYEWYRSWYPITPQDTAVQKNMWMLLLYAPQFNQKIPGKTQFLFCLKSRAHKQVLRCRLCLLNLVTDFL